MINRSELLDPTTLDGRSEYEKNVIECAQGAGHGPRYPNTEHTATGALQQVINPGAIQAAECGAPGCDSDISDGIGKLAETLEQSMGENHAP